MEIYDVIGNHEEYTNIKQNRIIKLYILGYVFLSGFVWFEPSFTEALFALFAPVALVIGIRVNRKTLMLLITALTLNFASLICGLFNYQLINIRYNIIDIYLYINLIIFFSSLCRIAKNDNYFIEKIMNCWILTCIINISACSIIYIMSKTSIFGIDLLFAGVRFQGFFKDPNVLGPFLVPPALYIIEKIISSRVVYKKYIFCAAILSIGILLCFSRAAWLNYAFSVLVLFINCFKLNLKIKVRIMKITVLIIASTVLFFNLNFKLGDYKFSEFLRTRMKIQEYDQERFTSQGMVSKMVIMSPVFGIGPGNYIEISSRGAHSLYIRTLGEKGVLGFSMLIIVIISLIINKKAYRRYRFAISSFFGILINSFFIDSLHWRHVWILVALIMYIIKSSAQRDAITY